jgi:hypothetical protein
MNQWSFGEILAHIEHSISNNMLIVLVTLDERCSKYFKGFYIQNVDVVLCSSFINIYKCQTNKERSKILLTFNMFNNLTLYNLGGRLFLINMMT